MKASGGLRWAVEAVMLVLGVLALAACGSAERAEIEPSISSEAPTTSAPTPSGRTVTELTGFSSPDGNVGCYIDPEAVRCDIEQRDWEPPAAPASCELDYGQGIRLDGGGKPAFVCAGDTALRGGGPLAPGETIRSGRLSCTAQPTGVDCVYGEGEHGFLISKERYELR